MSFIQNWRVKKKLLKKKRESKNIFQFFSESVKMSNRYSGEIPELDSMSEEDQSVESSEVSNIYSEEIPELDSMSEEDQSVESSDESSEEEDQSVESGDESSEEMEVPKRALEAVEQLLLDQFGQWANYSENGGPQFNYPCPRSAKNVQFDEELGLVPGPQVCDLISISYDKALTRQKYVRIFSLLDKIHCLLVEEKKATLRELYYQMLSQDGGTITQISEAVLAICILLKIPRAELHIQATSKGLVAGSISYTTEDLVEVDCSHSTEGESIPDNLSNIQSSAKLVVVIEKDAVFQRLLSENFLEDLGIPAIMITGKGYPDLNTRRMLRRLAFELLPSQAKFVCLVDGNPFGMEILSVYKYGSLAMTFCGEPLAVPKLDWVGIYPSEVHSIPKEYIHDFSDRDYKKARSLQERSYFSPQMQEELDQMIRSGKKVEIEDVQETENSKSPLSPKEYLGQKLTDMIMEIMEL